jgi:uncharacterized protein
VRVLEVDLERKRISLSARKDDAGARPAQPAQRGAQPAQRGGPPPQARRDAGRPQMPPQQGKFANNPFEKLLRK